MSEMEFEQGNEELFGVVNDHATPEAAYQAEQIAQAKAKADAEAEQREWEHQMAERRRAHLAKSILGLILRLLICTAAAILFLAALLLPNWVPVLCFAGLAACLIVGAVVTDRAILSWR